jgi:hypothetical protein
VADGGERDWWAAEGNPEHLRPLQEAGSLMFDDPVLRDAGIVIFSSGVDIAREVLQLRVAAPDAAAAQALIEQRYAVRAEVTAVASAEYVDSPIAWDWWSQAPDGHSAIDVWVDARVDDILRVQLVENSVEVVVALRGGVYQGNITADYIPFPTRVHLQKPVSGRRVIDGTTGKLGRTRPPT